MASRWFYLDVGIVAYLSTTAIVGLLEYGPGVALPVVLSCTSSFCYAAYPTALLEYSAFMLVLASKDPMLAPFATLFTISVSEIWFNLLYPPPVIPSWVLLPVIWCIWFSVGLVVFRWRRVRVKPTWLMLVWGLQLALAVVHPTVYTVSPPFTPILLTSVPYYIFNLFFLCLAMYRSLDFSAVSLSEPPAPRSSSA